LNSNYKNFAKAKAIEAENRKRWLKVDPHLSDNPGIYILTRVDEDGFKFGYAGQAKKLITRLCQHSVGHQQHIDLSLKKHGLYSEKNPCGWRVVHINCPESELDEMEQYCIRQLADQGYQLRNKTSGSQGAGKKQIDAVEVHHVRSSPKNNSLMSTGSYFLCNNFLFCLAPCGSLHMKLLHISGLTG
jgi:hypothetical protein